MEMELQEAQERLEKKRALSKQTEPEPTFSVESKTVPSVCSSCGHEFEAFCFLGSIATICNDCEQKKIAEYERMELERERLEREKALQRRIIQRLGDCNIGERFSGMVFDDYKPSCPNAENVLQSCREYVGNFKDKSGCSLLMIGSPGTGKNMLAAIICQEIIKADFSALHTTAMKLVRKVKDSWKNKDLSEQSVIDSFVIPSLLVIDEIGVQFGTPTEQLYLTEIINERYEKRRPTILISNLTLSQLTEVMGARVIDRFYDDGSKMLVFNWESHRRKKQ